MIPEGNYRVRGVEGMLRRKGSNTPGVKVWLDIIEGEHAGKRVVWIGWLTEKSVHRTFESLRTLGWRGDMLDDLTGIDGNEAIAVVAHENYAVDGVTKTRVSVKWINRIASTEDRYQLSKDAARTLALRFKSLAMGSRVGAPAVPSAPAKDPAKHTFTNAVGPGPTVDVNDDDIPF